MSIKDTMWFHHSPKTPPCSLPARSSRVREGGHVGRGIRFHGPRHDQVEFSQAAVNAPAPQQDIPRAIPVEIRRALPVPPTEVRGLRRLSSLASHSNASFGTKLAADAERICQTGAVRVKPDKLLCFRGVKAALLCNGIVLKGKNRGGQFAWEAADKLAQNSHFQEIRVNRSGQEGQDLFALSQTGKLAAPRFTDKTGRQRSLEHLPAGAIVVWHKGQTPEAGLTYGHISIALGDGREASDRFRQQMQNLPANCRIFLPRP